MNRKKWLIAALVLTALAVLGTAAYFVADEIHDRREDQREREQKAALDKRNGELVPLARILELTAQQVPGDVVKVELEDEHGRRLYEIKVLAENGRVRELKFDAFDATLIEIEDD